MSLMRFFFWKWAPSKCHIGTNKTGQNIPREVPDATSWNANFKIYPGRTPVAPITCTCTSYRAHLIGPLGLTSGHRPSTVPPIFLSLTLNIHAIVLLYDCAHEKRVLYGIFEKKTREITSQTEDVYLITSSEKCKT